MRNPFVLLQARYQRSRSRAAVRARYAPSERLFTRFEKMTKLEKAALASATIGAAFNIFLYSIGFRLDQAGAANLPLFVARVTVGLLTAGAFDLIAIVTVLGQRAGRRSQWATRTAWAAAIVSALIALDVSGVYSMPWLHAANSLIVLAFMLHLAAPRQTPRFLQIRQLAHQLLTALRQERDRTRQALTDNDRLRQALTERDSLVAIVQQELAVTRQAVAQQPPVRQERTVRIVTHELTWPEFERFVTGLAQEMTERSLSQPTIRRRVAAFLAPMTEAETINAD